MSIIADTAWFESWKPVYKGMAVSLAGIDLLFLISLSLWEWKNGRKRS